jgi:hypothetical protein
MTIRSDIFKFLQSQPVGACSSDIAKACSTTRRNVSHELAYLRDTGIANKTHDLGADVRWALTEYVQAARDDIHRIYTERRTIAQAKRRLYDREKSRRQYSSVVIGDADEKPFKHIIVNALDAKPLKKCGPASVWELA